MKNASSRDLSKPQGKGGWGGGQGLHGDNVISPSSNHYKTKYCGNVKFISAIKIQLKDDNIYTLVQFYGTISDRFEIKLLYKLL